MKLTVKMIKRVKHNLDKALLTEIESGNVEVRLPSTTRLVIIGKEMYRVGSLIQDSSYGGVFVTSEQKELKMLILQYEPISVELFQERGMVVAIAKEEVALIWPQENYFKEFQC